MFSLIRHSRVAQLVLMIAFIGLGAVTAFVYYDRVGAGSRPEFDGAVEPDLGAASYQLGALGWNRFRGPNGSGVIAGAKIPWTWSDQENLLWKAPLPGAGSSSPVLTDDLVFVTSYTRPDMTARKVDELTLHVHCFARDTGKSAWSREFEAVLPEADYSGMGLPEHGYATHTPVTDGRHLFVFFGKSGVRCLDLAGNQVWHTSVGDGLNARGWGSCASPILYADTVIVNAAEESGAVVALDKKTGTEVWRAEGSRLGSAFSTPTLVRVGRRVELIVAVVGEVWGLNPQTGKLLWFAKTPIGNNVSPAVFADGKRVFVYGGYGDRGSICVEAGGAGDVTDSKVIWTSRLTSYVSTPVLVDGRLRWMDQSGKYFCQDAATGELISKARMPREVFGQSTRPAYASMIAVDNRVLIQTRTAGVFVLDSTDALSVLHHNQFGDRTISNATPAVGDGQLFLRSDAFLYCVGVPLTRNR